MSYQQIKYVNNVPWDMVIHYQSSLSEPSIRVVARAGQLFSEIAKWYCMETLTAADNDEEIKCPA